MQFYENCADKKKRSHPMTRAWCPAKPNPETWHENKNQMAISQKRHTQIGNMKNTTPFTSFPVALPLLMVNMVSQMLLLAQKKQFF